MNSPQIDVYAVPAALPDTVATPEQDLVQPGGHHRRPTEPPLTRARGWIETVAVSAAVLTGVLLTVAHGSAGTPNRGAQAAPAARATTAPLDPNRGAMTCTPAGAWPAMGEHAGGDQGSRHNGTIRTGPTARPAAADASAVCTSATTVDPGEKTQMQKEQQRVVQSAYTIHAAFNDLTGGDTPGGSHSCPLCLRKRPYPHVATAAHDRSFPSTRTRETGPRSDRAPIGGCG